MSALLLVCVRGIDGKFHSDPAPSHRFWSICMSGIGRLSFVLAVAGLLNLGLWVGGAEAPEWNPVRTHAVPIGPEASRLVVGFRATASNTVVKSINIRARAQSVK